jgi:hypothetical protein
MQKTGFAFNFIELNALCLVAFDGIISGPTVLGLIGKTTRQARGI